MRNADLSGAILAFETNFTNADLRGANLNRARFLEEAIWTNAKPDPKWAKLIKVITEGPYSGQDLSEVDFSESCINGIDGLSFAGVNFSSSDFNHASWQEMDFRNANFRGSDLRNAYFYGSDFQGSNLSGSNLSGANLVSTNLRSKQICQVQLSKELISLALCSAKLLCRMVPFAKIALRLHRIFSIRDA